MELAISQVPVMVNAALFSSGVKLIFRFQVTRHWQQADPLLTEREKVRARDTEADTLHGITFSHTSANQLRTACEFVLFKQVSSHDHPALSSFHFVIPCPSLSLCLSSFLIFSVSLSFWAVIRSYQTPNSASGPHVNIQRGCWLLWRGGKRETHISHILQMNWMCLCCFCLLYLCFSPSPSNPPYRSCLHYSS